MIKRRVDRMIVAVVALVVSITFPAAADDGYPLREKFSRVKYLTTDALDRDYQKTIVVDVRSKIEFDVIHINKALHISVATALFIKELEKVRDKQGSAPIAFYCNGHTCAKSYKAAEQAMEAGFQNVYAYDAGIYDWVKAYPARTTLMGKTPASREKLIAREALAKRKIPFSDFLKRTKNQDIILIDVREPFQRKEIPQFHNTLRNIPSDRFVELLAAGEFKGKQLLIMDAVGKQVEWIQYYLESNGYTDFYFLDKGVESAVSAGK